MAAIYSSFKQNVDYVVGLAPTDLKDGEPLWTFSIKNGKICTISSFYKMSIEFIIRNGNWHIVDENYNLICGIGDEKYRISQYVL